MNSRHVLVVDDDPAVGKVLGALLRQEGFVSRHVTSGAEALGVIERLHFDLVVTDLRMPGMDGMALLGELKRRWPGLPVMMLTAHGTVDLAVEAMKRGAAGFMLKPFDRTEILYEIRKVLASRGKETLPSESLTEGAIIGDSPAMAEVQSLIDRAAESNATVLVRGESGTGKELVVRAIHERSPRRAEPMVTVHCGALPETLIEDELFGHERGAFTGASSPRQGRVALADGGTLFLDEVGDVPLSVQVKLLRVIQEREFEPLGSSKTARVDVRFVAATHRELEKMCQEGSFRDDLFYRLDVITIWLPPLRQRGDDVGQLARHFCTLYAESSGKPDAALDPEAVALLAAQRWPGNVRELQNFVERLVVLGDGGSISEADVQSELQRRPLASDVAAQPEPSQSEATNAAPETKDQQAPTLDDARRGAEQQYLHWALQRCGGNRTQAARVSGVSRRTFYNLLQKHGLE